MNRTYILQGTAVQCVLVTAEPNSGYPPQSRFHLNPVQYTFSQSMILG